MAAEPSVNGNDKPLDLAGPRATALAMGGAAVLLWFVLGPDNPFVAVVVTGGTMNLGLVAIPLAVRIPQRWYQVPRAERVLHGLLGVSLFGRLLDLSGWNRRVALPMRQLTVAKASLPRLLVQIHASEGAHAIAFIPHVALALLALATGHSGGALWILLPGVLVHLYPVLLQRAMSLRVAPLVRKAAG
jgi:hypothetical protein